MYASVFLSRGQKLASLARKEGNNACERSYVERWIADTDFMMVSCCSLYS
jgi:hypothetical protein